MYKGIYVHAKSDTERSSVKKMKIETGICAKSKEC